MLDSLLTVQTIAQNTNLWTVKGIYKIKIVMGVKKFVNNVIKDTILMPILNAKYFLKIVILQIKMVNVNLVFKVLNLIKISNVNSYQIIVSKWMKTLIVPNVRMDTF